MLTQEQTDNVNSMITELISGKYAQGKGVMKRSRLDDTEDEYCCLGVAAEGVLGNRFARGTNNSCVYVNDNGFASGYGALLPEDAAKFGFNEQLTHQDRVMLNRLLPSFGFLTDIAEVENREHVLIRLNDAGASFDTIAAFILSLGWNRQ